MLTITYSIFHDKNYTNVLETLSMKEKSLLTHVLLQFLSCMPFLSYYTQNRYCPSLTGKVETDDQQRDCYVYFNLPSDVGNLGYYVVIYDLTYANWAPLVIVPLGVLSDSNVVLVSVVAISPQVNVRCGLQLPSSPHSTNVSTSPHW